MLRHVRRRVTRLCTVVAPLASFCLANDSRTHITLNNVDAPAPSFHFSCCSCRHISLRSLLGAKDNMLHKLTLIQVWPAAEILCARTAAAQPACLINWWVAYPGWQGRWHRWLFFFFFSISDLVRWRCSFYLDLFKPKAGRALQLAIEGDGHAKCKFMRIITF